MGTLNDILKELEMRTREEVNKEFKILAYRAKIIEGTSMADLYRQCHEQGVEIPPLPVIGIARLLYKNPQFQLKSIISNAFKNNRETALEALKGDYELEQLLWKYDWISSSTLGRLRSSDGKDYGIFTHINPFETDEKIIEIYNRQLVSGGIPLSEEEVDKILSLVDGKDVIAVPFQEIQLSPRGKIQLSEILNNGQSHVVAK